uniref:Glypican-1 n=1 Tax=Ursus maritimus TaxID=29073 RepID=A0A452U299_URSMA
DSMVLITDKFRGPSGAESVIGNVHLWLAEAINALQDNKDMLTAKVIQGCGNPKVNPQGSGPEEKRHQGEGRPSRAPCGLTAALQVSEAKTQLRDAQDFWISLPSMLCSERLAMSSASDDRCWNGMAKGRYLPEVMGDGLANQINNPEVEVDITKPDMTVRQQIMQLKVMTNRLRGAYSGNDVDFQDASAGRAGGVDPGRPRRAGWALRRRGHALRTRARRLHRACGCADVLPTHAFACHPRQTQGPPLGVTQAGLEATPGHRMGVAIETSPARRPGPASQRATWVPPGPASCRGPGGL